MCFFRRKRKEIVDPGMNFLVVGLGNIGAEYAHTRHNLGFMVLDAWAQASNILFEPGRYGSVATVSYKGRKIHLLKPSTYMNLSGNAVRYWIQKIKLPLSNVVSLGTKQFARIRIGIGNDFHPGEQIDFVLGALTPEQEEQVARTGLRIRDGIQTFCTAGPDFAMNYLNSKPQKAENE